MDLSLVGRERPALWRDDLPWTKQLALALTAACLIGLAAQVRLPVPWSPVPVTAQTFVVLLTGLLLGRGWGGLSVGAYLGAGVLGVPCFQGFKGGLAYLAGPTGGYLIGFLAAAVLLGWTVRRWPVLRRLPFLLGLLVVVNFGVIHGLGLLHLAQVTGIHDLGALLWVGVIPFVPGDLTKVAAAAVLTAVVYPAPGKPGPSSRR